jgi:hypothetical protein
MRLPSGETAGALPEKLVRGEAPVPFSFTLTSPDEPTNASLPFGPGKLASAPGGAHSATRLAITDESAAASPIRLFARATLPASVPNGAAGG